MGGAVRVAVGTSNGYACGLLSGVVFLYAGQSRDAVLYPTVMTLLFSDCGILRGCRLSSRVAA